MGFRDFMYPGGRHLARRLDHLKDTLENIGDRLRETIADTIGQTLSGIVRDTAMRVFENLAEYLPGPAPIPVTPTYQPFVPDEHNIWPDDDEEEYQCDPEPEPIQPSTEGSSEKVAAAVSAGMHVASWWLRRWTGKGRILTTAAVGLVTAGVAYVGGPIAAAVLSLAGAATEFTSLSDAVGSDSIFDSV